MFGPLPDPLPPLCLNNQTVRIVPATVYVGVHITSTKPNIFAVHREAKAKAARNVANTVLSLESYIDCIPPRVARLLYMAQVDPHLVYGCEVDVDVNDTTYALLEEVQVTFLRRVLMLSPFSPLVVLYPLMNIWPIRYRRTLLLLRYLRYLVVDRPPLPYAALSEAHALVRARHPSWWSDLAHVLADLPCPVAFDCRPFPTEASVSNLISDLRDSLATYVARTIRESPRLKAFTDLHLQGLPDTPSCSQLFRMPSYLRLSRNKRRAMTKVVASEHTFAIQTLRYDPGRVEIREWRVCRWCRTQNALEDEEHVLFHCDGAPIRELREDLLHQLGLAQHNMLRLFASLAGWKMVDYISRKPDLLAIFATFVDRTLEICKTTPPLRITSQSEFDALPPY